MQHTIKIQVFELTPWGLREVTPLAQDAPPPEKPDDMREPTTDDFLLAGELSTVWPMSHRHPEDSVPLAVYINDHFVDERLDPTTSEVFIKGYDAGMGEARLKTIAAFDAAVQSLWPLFVDGAPCQMPCHICRSREDAQRLRSVIFGENA